MGNNRLLALEIQNIIIGKINRIIGTPLVPLYIHGDRKSVRYYSTPGGRVYTPVVAYIHLWLRIYTCGLYTNLFIIKHCDCGARGTVQNMDSGLDWTGLDAKMDCNIDGSREWAWLATEVNWYAHTVEQRMYFTAK